MYPTKLHNRRPLTTTRKHQGTGYLLQPPQYSVCTVDLLLHPDYLVQARHQFRFRPCCPFHNPLLPQSRLLLVSSYGPGGCAFLHLKSVRRGCVNPGPLNTPSLGFVPGLGDGNGPWPVDGPLVTRCLSCWNSTGSRPTCVRLVLAGREQIYIASLKPIMDRFSHREYAALSLRHSQLVI